MSSSDTFKEGTPTHTAIDKSGASFHSDGKIPTHRLRTPMLHLDNSPLINNGQLELSNDVSRSTSSLQGTSPFEFEDLPTWSLPSDGGSITSPTVDLDSHERDELQVNDDSDTDEEPRKRQKTQTGSPTGDGRVKFSNVKLVKSQDKRSTLVDDGSRKLRLPNFDTPTTPEVGSADVCVTHLAISNETSLLAVEHTKKKAESSSPTSISSHIQIEKSNHRPTNPCFTTVTIAKSVLSQGPSVKEEKEESSVSTRSRKKTNRQSGLLVPRPLAVSKSTSTSDSLNAGAVKHGEEPPKRTRGLALRPVNSSYGGKLKKSRGRKADQDELELWTDADVARIRFRKPDELRLLEQVEEEDVRRSVSHILTRLMEMKAKNSNEDVARNEKTMSNGIQNQVALAESSIYTRYDDLVEEIFGLGKRNRRMTLLKPKTGLVKQKQSLERSRASSNMDLPIVTHSKLAITNDEIVTNPSHSADRSLISEVPTMGVNQTVNSPESDAMETWESQVSPSRISVSEDEHQLNVSDIPTEGTSHSGGRQLFRRKQDLHSEDVTILGKRTREGMIVGERKMDWYDLSGEDAEKVGEGEESDLNELDMDEDGRDRTQTANELKFLETPSKAPKWTKMVKNIQPVDGVGVAVTSDIEREQVENTLKRRCPSIDNDEDQEDEETGRDMNSLQVSLPQLEDWSRTLRSLIKGKKKFQHQDLINLKNTLQEIYNNRANISATCSLAQEVYEVSQLEDYDVPNKDELGLRALASRSMQHWGIRRQREA